MSNKEDDAVVRVPVVAQPIAVTVERLAVHIRNIPVAIGIAEGGAGHHHGHHPLHARARSRL
jgi:hypothetical protein